MVHLHKIFTKLNLSEGNGLFLSNTQRESLFSNRIERLLVNVIKPDAFFCVDNKPFILFFENLKNKKEKLKQIWNYNESPIIIISENDSVEIYNGFEFIVQNESLKFLGGGDKLDDFNYFELVTGDTWEKYEKNFNTTNRVDYHLLSNIKATREKLILQSLSSELANSILGKIIFVRYLIDRKVKLDFEQQGESRFWTNDEFCELLLDKNRVISFFEYLKVKFNGDLFPLTDNDINSIPISCFNTLVQLLLGNEVSSGQISLFDLYDFSIIPVEFISNIYELFIGQNEQEKEGAYYTPLFLVDYVLAETVEQKLRYKKSSDCKVLDPSCGSGIFLVETLRKIIEKYQKNNPKYLDDPENYKRELNQLVFDNIFGIDKDKSAINVAIFSIYLTLLDYQNPSDIESFRFPVLKGVNFFVNDFFDTKAIFNNIINVHSFDFILGNPPWKRGKGEKKYPLFDQYIDRRKKEEETADSSIEIKISNKEIAQAFVLRTSDFSSKNTKVGFIVTSKILYNLNAKGFREYFLDKFLIYKVFELSPVRKEIFNNSNDKAVAPASILFYKYSPDELTDENVIEHITLKPSRFFSLFKIFTIQRADYKRVVQKRLKDYDYLWKVLVYGNYLDFNLIRRLKEKYESILDIINDVEKFYFGQGIQVGGGDKRDASVHVGKKYINSRKDIEPFWINSSTNEKWDEPIVHRPKVEKLFRGPMILITKGFKKTFRCVSGYIDDDVVFRDALTSINAFDVADSDILKLISGILNSSLFSYINLQTFSSSGIEREQAHNTEKFSIPFVFDKSILSIYNEIVNLKKELKSFTGIISGSNNSIIDLKIKELDAAVLSAFSFSDQDQDLLKYSTDVMIPIIMKHKGHERKFASLNLDSHILMDYISMFLDSFNSVYKKQNLKLIVDVKHSSQIIGLFFKVVSQKQNINSIETSGMSDNAILSMLLSLGIHKVTDRLFIQKDIRGFEEDGFYIIKPNEYKLWHKGIAHLDLNEFKNAILMAGKK
ncbi:N-6 DNA methylase [Aureispira sp. CCB-E]|uniref:N-6 DNA methylase n=1 Tax=Aureispira sp. CCB-E TaxID=3051121 RepID=UPI0028692EE9|nr:N-6 DNA methylase [Aureispira sp. CCB-E]WMX15267.1 N-6 DNA methylase [Aureispira sp. CCB-E]